MRATGRFRAPDTSRADHPLALFFIEFPVATGLVCVVGERLATPPLAVASAARDITELRRPPTYASVTEDRSSWINLTRTSDLLVGNSSPSDTSGLESTASGRPAWTAPEWAAGAATSWPRLHAVHFRRQCVTKRDHLAALPLAE